MQMLTPLEQLKLRLEGQLGSLIKQHHSIQSLREEICKIMCKFPQYYSWSNRHGENIFQVEIYDRATPAPALLVVQLDLV